MQLLSAFLLSLASWSTIADAHPAYGKYLDEKSRALLQTQEKRAAKLQNEKRDTVSGSSSGLVGGLVGIVGGAATSVLSSVSPDDYRPQAGYEFQEPNTSGGPGVADQRGPCPGMFSSIDRHHGLP